MNHANHNLLNPFVGICSPADVRPNLYGVD
jgi:hypothetical protein